MDKDLDFIRTLFSYGLNPVKIEMELVYHRQYQTRMGAKQDLFEYIHVWYNRKRRHSAPDYLSPEQNEDKGQYRMTAWSFLILHKKEGKPRSCPFSFCRDTDFR